MNEAKNGGSLKKDSECLVSASSPASFMTLLCDHCALPEEVLALAFNYLHQYKAYPSDGKLDAYSVALASLSLASKVSEHLRRLREFLVPAYSIMHPSKPPLTYPSILYDDLRDSLVAAEMILLRTFKFDIRHLTAFDYLPRVLRLISPEGSSKSLLSTSAKYWISIGLQHPRMSLYFPARAIAVAATYIALRDQHITVAPLQVWMKQLRMVDLVDVEESIAEFTAIRALMLQNRV